MMLKILFMIILSLITKKFNEFVIYVLCKIKNNAKINVYKSSTELHMLLPIFLPQHENYDV